MSTTHLTKNIDPNLILQAKLDVETLYLAHGSLEKNIVLNFICETRCRTHGLTNETSR